MRVIKPSYEILSLIDRNKILQSIEVAGRTCYKSESKISEDSASKFVKMIIANGHLSVIEHVSLTVRFICDRGITHELVRHRLCSFSQESTRYVNYKESQMKFILPCWMDDRYLGEYQTYEKRELLNAEEIWLTTMFKAEENYNILIREGWKPQQARSILPNSLASEIVVTANLREWMTVLKQRTSSAAHPQMREIMTPLLKELQSTLPEIFENIK